MKNLFTALFISIAFMIAGCGSEQEGHSHGEDGDHTHEAPAQPSTGDDGDAVHIGSGVGSDEETDHSHDEGDHSHEEEHSHDDSAHSHKDEEHSH